MNLIENLSDDSRQTIQLLLPDNSVVVLQIVYQPTTQKWIMNVTYGTLVYNGIIISLFPNLMRQWRQLIPFGIGCAASDGVDPFDVQDFLTGRCQLYLLDEDDIEDLEATTLGAGS